MLGIARCAVAGSVPCHSAGPGSSPGRRSCWHPRLFVCTMRGVRISYDPAKNQRNIRDRGLSFESVAEFDFEGAQYAVDKRQDYGETRYIAVGMLGVRLHVLCFAETPEGIRVISFRKANAREVNRYAKAKAAD